MAEFVGNAQPISQTGLDDALRLLTVGPAEIWAVLSVETNGVGFLADRRPCILFERHIFHRLTGGAFDTGNPNISAVASGGYLGGAREYDRLQQAIALNRQAALNSASWGIGQIMGFNASAAGFDSVESMVDAAIGSEDAQLAGMARFLVSQGLQAPLSSHDWRTFARGYNGPDFQKNSYDARLAASFQKFSQGPVPDLGVRQAQVFLTFLGIDPGGIDGIIGKRTRSAVVQFREQNGLGDDDELDADLIVALREKVGTLSVAAVA